MEEGKDKSPSDKAFLIKHQRCGLVTAEILYYLPDYPGLLQSYTCQIYDCAPDFPQLRRFLRFWQEKLDGPLHSVGIAHFLGRSSWSRIDLDETIH